MTRKLRAKERRLGKPELFPDAGTGRLLMAHNICLGLSGLCCHLGSALK